LSCGRFVALLACAVVRWLYSKQANLFFESNIARWMPMMDERSRNKERACSKSSDRVQNTTQTATERERARKNKKKKQRHCD
jgi:hypothetical protein